jgi:hypothetical protein
MNHPNVRPQPKLALWLTYELIDRLTAPAQAEWRRRLQIHLADRDLVSVSRGRQIIIWPMRRPLDAYDRRALTRWVFSEPDLLFAAIEIRPLSDLAAKPTGLVARLGDAANDPAFKPGRQRR